MARADRFPELPPETERYEQARTEWRQQGMRLETPAADAAAASSRGLVVTVAVVVLGVVAWMQARDTARWLTDFGIGDAAAYVRIAWNVCRGAGVTYDGVQPTNGFHPLWLALHIPLLAGARTPWERLDLARAFWTVTVLVAALAWGRVLKRATGSTLAACATALLMAVSGWSLYAMYQGLETPLVLVFVALALLEVRRLQGPRPPAQALLDGLRTGAVLGLGVLARLDVVFVLIPLGVLALTRLTARGRAALVAAGAAIVVPVLAWNATQFGSIVPVSGVVKQQDGVSLGPLLAWWGGFVRLAARAHVPAAGPVMFAGLVTLLVLGTWLALRSRLLARTEPLLVLFPAALLHWLYYALRMREFNVPWHLYLQMAAAFAAVGLAFAALERGIARTRAARLAALLALCAVVLVGDAVYARLKAVRRPEVTAALQVGDWLAAHLPAGASYMMYDSWFAALRTPQLHPIDMSGLVGDAAMVPLAKQRRYDAMVARFHPQVVVLHISGACPATQPGVRWTTPTVMSREPFREAVLEPQAFVTAWRSLPASERRESWLAAMRDAAVCNPAR